MEGLLFLMIANLCFNLYAIYKLRSIDESLGIVMEFFAHLEPMTEEEYHNELEKSKKDDKKGTKRNELVR